MSAPGPIESDTEAMGLMLVLHSDSEGVYSGFKARYSFEPAKSIYGDCGGNVSTEDFGIITSPNFPKDYGTPSKNQASKSCNWFITVRPRYKILLIFEKFAVEGEPSGTIWLQYFSVFIYSILLGRGCPATVFRLWYDMIDIPIELCGEKLVTDKSWQYISTTNVMKFR